MWGNWITWIDWNNVFLSFIGLVGGLAVSAGVFAFVITLNVIPRYAAKTHTAKNVMSYENMIFLGGMFGCIASIFEFRMPLGTWFLVLFGISAGVYVGSLAVALAEILNSFPIMFRRIKLKIGAEWVITSMALGKVCGALYFYSNHMSQVS